MLDSKTAQATAPVDLVFSGEFELAASADDAWPHVLNYPAWQNFPIVQHVVGNPGGEGEVVRLKKETDGYTIGPYLARTLKLDHANHIVVWKVYLEPEQGDVEGLGGATQIQGNVEFRLAEVADDRCRFWYDLIYEFIVPSSDASELEAFKQQQWSDWNKAFQLTHEHLRELVQTGATTPA